MKARLKIEQTPLARWQPFFRETKSFVGETFQKFNQDRCSVTAAALAYFTLFSLAPLLVIVIMVGSFWYEASAVEGHLSQQMQTLVGPEGAAEIENMVSRVERPQWNSWSALIGLVTLLYGASKVVNQLQVSLNDAWQVRPDPEQGGVKNFLLKRLLSIGMLFAIGFLVLVSLVLSSVLHAIGTQISEWVPGAVSHWGLVAWNEGLMLVTATVLFAGMFKFLPDAEIRWFDVWVGAGVTALLLVAGKFGIGLYLGSRDLGSVYGAGGSLVLVLLWMYFSASILLLGAEMTQVWATRYGKGIHPSPGAVRVEQEIRRRDAAPLDNQPKRSSPSSSGAGKPPAAEVQSATKSG